MRSVSRCRSSTGTDGLRRVTRVDLAGKAGAQERSDREEASGKQVEEEEVRGRGELEQRALVEPESSWSTEEFCFHL